MTIKEALVSIKSAFENEYGFDVTDFRLEELYPLENPGIQSMTVSFLRPVTRPPRTTAPTDALMDAINPHYARIYKKIDFDMNTKKIIQMRMFTE